MFLKTATIHYQCETFIIQLSTFFSIRNETDFKNNFVSYSIQFILIYKK